MWTAAFIALAALGETVAGMPNPAFRLFEWVSRVLPGAVVTAGIDLVVQFVGLLGRPSTATAAKEVEHALAVGLAITLGAAVGGVIAIFVRRGWRALWIGLVTGAIGAGLYLVLVARESDLDVPMFAMTAVGFIAWGVLVAVSIGALAAHGDVSAERRRVLLLLGIATATTTAIALGFSRLLSRGATRVARTLGIEQEAAKTSGAAASPSSDQLLARVMPVPATRPELTATEDFYRVDINLTPPTVEAASWRLDIAGLVDKPRLLTLDELRARPAISQIITLECISNPVAGDLIGTSRWTGISLGHLLDELGVAANARAVSFEAADGFYESASLEDARDPRALLVYEMNGEPLTVEHGFPLRLYLPNRHGMKLPKWIKRMEVVATPRPGYWVERGWSETAIPHTTSVIDTVQATGEGAARQLSIGGIAYAGARGITRVEVQIDDGPWQPAQLRTPALSQLTWVQWRLDVPYREGRHTFRVRAYDGTGAVQDATVRPPHPDGATGIQTIRKTT